jgi:M6 family metalloprotease-like protein
MKYFKFTLIIIPVFILVIHSFNSTGNIEKSEALNSVSSLPYYPLKEGDTLKALIIYTRYRNDFFTCDQCKGWDPDSAFKLPVWWDKMLTPMGEPIDFHPSISGYFDAMSMHKWQFRGDEFPELYKTQHDAIWYKEHGGLGGMSEEVISNLDSKINFADYDRYDPNDINHNGIINEPDGIVDMIIIWTRWINSDGIEGGYYSGVAGLGGRNNMNFPNGTFITNDSEMIDGKKVAVKIEPGYPGSGIIGEAINPEGMNIFAHEFGHYIFGAVHYAYVGMWNMMNGDGVGIMSTYERSDDRVNWIPKPKVIDQPDVYHITLHDFETTGEAYKIMTDNGFYILENRSEKGIYSKKGLMQMPGNGLLITKNDYSRIICADQLWQWELSPEQNTCNYCENNLSKQFKFPFVKLYPSDSGYFNFDLHNVCTRDATGNNNCKTHGSSKADELDLWQVNYNTVFSPWSNPKTENALNGKPILLEIINKNSDFSLDINIYYGIVEPFTGTSPSKPLWLRKTNADYFIKLEWLPNKEPDVSFYKIYSKNKLTKNLNYKLIGKTENNINVYFISGRNDDEINKFIYKITCVDSEGKESVMSDEAVFVN